ncbi:MAG: alpha-ketoacid dehydrogenase subunit beta [Treponema sp.]|nr:alpha-ketoacid dehydrogenase subunit beta [Treponema sp.]
MRTDSGTGARRIREISYAEAIREALREELLRDPRVFLMGEDVGIYGGTFGVSAGLFREFGPDRILDTPISEAAIAGAAAGAALTGTRPIVEIPFSDFLSLALDQIGNQAAKMRYMFGGTVRVPLVVRSPAGSGTGAGAQHSQSQEAVFCHFPGLKVVVPSTPYDAKGLLKTAVRDDNPVVFLEQKLLYKDTGPVPEEEYLIPFGKAEVKRAGSDLTIAAWGRMVGMCLDVAERLDAEGISVEVVDPRTLVPLDARTITASAAKTGRLVIVHEAVKTGGFGGEIAALVADSEAFPLLKAPIRRVAGFDIPVPYSPNLERNAVPTPERIEQAVRDLLSPREKLAGSIAGQSR